MPPAITAFGAAADEKLRPVLAAAMACLAVTELAYMVSDVALAGLLARCAALVVLAAVLPRFGLREWALLAVAVALSWGLVQRDGGWGEVGLALDRGAFFASFILLMMLLREAAVTSDAVLEMGRYLTGQQPGRRFVASFLAGHLAGVLLNFGAISLLAPLVQRGVRAEPPKTTEDERRMLIREQRQLSALVRGFAVVILWAPTTLTQAIILASVPGVDVSNVIVLGLGFAALMLGLGWAEDRLRWGKPRARAPELPILKFPRLAARDLVLVAVTLAAGTWVTHTFLGITTAEGLMLMAPMMLVGWVFTQHLDRGTGRAFGVVGRRLREILAGPVPNMTRGAFALGAAGFIGSAAASLAPVDLIIEHLALNDMPPWLFLSLLPVIIVAVGNVAISPVMAVVFLAAILGALPQLPAPPDLIALSLGAGWALAMTASPNATGPIMLSGVTGLPTTTLTWRWNGVYSLAALGLLFVLFFAFT